MDKKVGNDVNDKGSLKNLVNEEFKRIDKNGYRDDQEIWNAGRNICNKLIQEIKNDNTKVYGEWALEPLSKLALDLNKEYNEMKGTKLLTNNKDKINQIANRIDSAENETLKRLKTNRSHKDKFENFYEGYNYTKEEIEAHHYYKKGRIIENIQSYVQNAIDQNRNIGKEEITSKIKPDLITLHKKEQTDIISGINKVVEKVNTIRKYINFKNGPYKSPKDLLCAMRGITDPKITKKITNNITVKQYGTGLTFFSPDDTSYQWIYNRNSCSYSGSGGFFSPNSEIPDLKGTLTVVKLSKIQKPEDRYSTVRHEGQHNRNSYFMPDKRQGKLVNAKDEITAFLRGGEKIKDIERYLTKDESQGGLYQYGLIGEERESHKKQVKELLKYANNLINLTKNTNIGLTRDNIISMLSGTPIYKRKKLYLNIMNTIKKHNNSLSSEIWRAGTAKKETEINEINLANSIEEIKHILNDPKYSHISRLRDDRGGIEISAMIDQVVAGKLDIKYIPAEIRQQIQKFIR